MTEAELKRNLASVVGETLMKEESLQRLSKLVSFGHLLVFYLVLITFKYGDATKQRERHRKQHCERVDWGPDNAEGEKMLKESIGVFKGGPDTYLLTFAEVRPNKKISVISEEAFDTDLYSPIGVNKSNIRKRRRGEPTEEVTVSLENTSSPTGQLQADILAASGEVEEVVSSVLKSTETMRKGLGVCRKVVPRNFVNPPIDNLTNVVIKNIVSCVEEKLQEDLGCHDCITLHGDLQVFLSWLIHGTAGMPCCPSYRRPMVPERHKHMFLFRQEAFGGVKCVTGATKIPTVCNLPFGSPSVPELVTHPNKKLDSSKNFVRVV